MKKLLIFTLLLFVITTFSFGACTRANVVGVYTLTKVSSVDEDGKYVEEDLFEFLEYFGIEKVELDIKEDKTYALSVTMLDGNSSAFNGTWQNDSSSLDKILLTIDSAPNDEPGEFTVKNNRLVLESEDSSIIFEKIS